VGKGAALPFRFLMKQHRLKREAKIYIKRYQSPQSLLGKEKAKA